MKRFVFSLDSVYELKKTLKDKIQAEYAAAEAVLDKAIKHREFLDRTLLEKTEEYESKLRKGMIVCDMQSYVNFFEELQNEIRRAEIEVLTARKAADLKREELVEVFKEIEVLKKLRQKQYREYLKEEEKKEANLLDDIMSFNITELGAKNAVNL